MVLTVSISLSTEAIGREFLKGAERLLATSERLYPVDLSIKRQQLF